MAAAGYGAACWRAACWRGDTVEVPFLGRKAGLLPEAMALAQVTRRATALGFPVPLGHVT